MIKRFIEVIRGLKDIESVYLFGSRARGEGDIESDIDIAVVVNDREMVKDITRKVVDASIKIGEELRISGELMLSPIVIEEALLKGNIGVGKRIREEGIFLWSKRLEKKKETAI
ncbi:MAG: nucleotidyltransferase domain-containing protein [Nitrospira sp.]|nr:nucleotidyltransferase domain-containing protein [Nitrospira sp.]